MPLDHITLNKSVPVLSLRDLQNIDFGVQESILNDIANEQVSVSLVIFALKYPSNVEPEEPNFVALLSVYDMAGDLNKFISLPKCSGEAVETLANPIVEVKSISVPGVSGSFHKDIFTTKRFDHRRNMFTRSTKGVLNYQSKHILSRYSETDLEKLRDAGALPSWATHVYIPDTYPEFVSLYDRVYRLATYRAVGETVDSVKNELVYFQPEPVPSFRADHPELAERMQERATKIMTIVPQEGLRICSLKEFFV